MGSLLTMLLPALLEVLAQAPKYVADVERIIDLVRNNHPPTGDEQAQIDAALEDAHNALQAP